MKVRMLSRNPSDFKRETKDDIFKIPRNYSASEHPFSAEREYVRAVNSAKLQRMMAKPFLGSLEGTTERITCISLNSETLGVAVFGTADGKIQYWDVSLRKRLFENQAHDAEIRGVSHCNRSSLMYTCSLDGQLKQWRMNHDDIASAWSAPLTSVLMKWAPHCLDHHPSADELLIGGAESCLLYSAARMDVPIREWTWGQEPVHCAKFNQVEQNVACVLSKDNSLMLIDCRQDEPIRKCSLDGQLKQWRMNHDDIASAWSAPLTSVLMKWAPHCLDHHPSADELLIGGAESCLLYSAARMDVPIREWTWGQEPVHCAKFNQVEQNVACVLSKDNSLMLIDCRQDEPIRKVKMDLKLNSLSWNPMEPFIFTVASEDYNVYTFDARYFKFPRRVYRGHVNAVLDVDYSPTGREFVTGSYDSTVRMFSISLLVIIRLWQADNSESFDVYHGRRMKRVLAVRFTLDSKFVISSSSDQNVRIWKAHASEKLGPVQPREKAALNMAEALRNKFKEYPEVKKILKKRHVPKAVFAATREHASIRAKERRKERNIRVFNKKDLPYVPEKDRHTIAQYK
ncbi:hypothetical protein AHF37_05564 [Paragonimus kellicotti]|nr:hypothetical protein AHF37_05564 [Paragonimus kellicotti]